MSEFLNNVRELSSSVAKQARRMAEIKNREARESSSKTVAAAEDKARSQTYPQAREQIVHAAAAGERHHTISLLVWSDDPIHDSTEAEVRVLTELFREQGFDVETIRDTMEPVGSDPLFDNTVYSVSVRVSW